jgi:hypothetical protein
MRPRVAAVPFAVVALAAVRLASADDSSKGPEPQALPTLQVPDVQHAAREDRRAVDPGEYWTGRARYVAPTLRLAPGGSFRVAGGDTGAAFTSDFLAGVRFGLTPGHEQWGLIPELGATLRTVGSEHEWTMGLGVGHGLGIEGATWAVLPRLVVDTSSTRPAYGVRTGLFWNFAENGFAVEVGHEYVARAAGATHDVRLTASVDLGLLAMAIWGGREWH